MLSCGVGKILPYPDGHQMFLPDPSGDCLL